MAGEGSAAVGTVLNKTSEAVVRQVWPVAEAENISAGQLVYLDGANGAKKFVTDASKAGRHAWFAETPADNTDGTVGVKYVRVWKKNAQVIPIKVDGAIPVGSSVKASTNNAGEIMANTFPAAISGGEDPTEAEFLALRLWHEQHIGWYLGHIGEGISAGVDNNGLRPTDAADNETNAVIVMD